MSTFIFWVIKSGTAKRESHSLCLLLTSGKRGIRRAPSGYDRRRPRLLPPTPKKQKKTPSACYPWVIITVEKT